LYLFCDSCLCCMVIFWMCSPHIPWTSAGGQPHTHTQGKWLTHGACNTGFVCASTLRLVVILSDKHLSNAEKHQSWISSFLFSSSADVVLEVCLVFNCMLVCMFPPLSSLFIWVWLCMKLGSSYKQILESPEGSNLHCKFPLSLSLSLSLLTSM